MKRILLIDDDEELAELLTDYLHPEGFSIKPIYRGDEGVEQALSGEYDLIILDIMLPGMHGLEVLKEIRSRSQIPVVMLTARGEEVDRIVGLELGADDYLPKPFNPRELLARVRAVMRRTRTDSPNISHETSQAKFTVGDIEVDMGSRKVHRSGQIVPLTTVEFDLLEILIRSAGTIVTKEDLSQIVLGRRLSPYDRSIDVHISNLRRKIGDETGPGISEWIRTIRGVGYQYARSQDE
ncbi:MAG TPA: DNA-binding response regulator [Syntrophobacteraceae bacterium]|nr:DNA-binding response regulator [Syntrophobacteraceae bacterium]